MNAQAQADLALSYTLFPDVGASRKVERRDAPWADLVQHITGAQLYKQKAACPLISLAIYGDKLTDKGSLRHAANVISCAGAEGDYDSEVMPPEEAQRLLQKAGIESVIYTSPSHKPEKPRWRVLLPFKEKRAPAERRAHVGRANRLLGGVLSRESFTLSQSFYIGRVDGAEYKVLATHGRPVDLADEVAPLYPDGSAGEQSGADSAPRDETTDAELRETFQRCEGRYQSMLKLSARWAARGMAEDDIVATLNGLLDTCPDGTVNSEGRDLRSDVARLAASAVVKWSDTRRERPREDQERPAQKVFTGGPVGLDALLTETLLPPFVIAGILPTDVGVLVGPGKTGKSTFCLLEDIHIILGLPFLGRPIVRSGPVLFVTAEDSEQRVKHRLFHLCKELNLTDEQRRRVAEQLMIEDLVGKGAVRFVEADRNGNLSQSAYVDQLIAKYADKRLVLINIDPQIFFGPGERYVNDGEAALMAAGARVMRETGAAVRFIHHTGKENARSKSTDQYTGRGGSAGSDNARFVQVLQRWDQRVEGMPGAFTDEDFRLGRVLSFNVPAVSDAPGVTELQWLLRRGWGFEVVDVESDSDQITNQRDLAKLLQYLRDQIGAGVKHTRTSLEDQINTQSVPFTRPRLRTLVHLALQHKHIVEPELPKEEQQGARKKYLKPTAHDEGGAAEPPSIACAPSAPRQAPEATPAEHAVLNAIALKVARKFPTAVAPGVVAELAAVGSVALPTEEGKSPAQIVGALLYRCTGQSGETRAHCRVEGGPPIEVTVRRSGEKPWRYQFKEAGAPVVPERADGM